MFVRPSKEDFALVSMILSENVYGIYFIEMPDYRQDWLGQIEKTDDGYKLTYRHRYYKDDKTFDSEDEKHWYVMDLPDLATALEKLEFIKRMSEQFMNGKSYDLLMGDKSMDEFMEEFREMPFVHMETHSVN